MSDRINGIPKIFLIFALLVIISGVYYLVKGNYIEGIAGVSIGVLLLSIYGYQEKSK